MSRRKKNIPFGHPVAMFTKRIVSEAGYVRLLLQRLVLGSSVGFSSPQRYLLVSVCRVRINERHHGIDEKRFCLLLVAWKENQLQNVPPFSCGR